MSTAQVMNTSPIDLGSSEAVSHPSLMKEAMATSLQTPPSQLCQRFATFDVSDSIPPQLSPCFSSPFEDGSGWSTGSPGGESVGVSPTPPRQSVAPGTSSSYRGSAQPFGSPPSTSSRLGTGRRSRGMRDSLQLSRSFQVSPVPMAPPLGEAVRVIVRCRPPLSAAERREQQAVRFYTRQKAVEVQSFGMERNTNRFCFDRVLWSGEMPCEDGEPPVSQEMVYEDVARPLLQHALEGYNSTLLAYGATGSGKTYTMMGAVDDSEELGSENRGIIPRICRELFEELDRRMGKAHCTSPRGFPSASSSPSKAPGETSVTQIGSVDADQLERNDTRERSVTLPASPTKPCLLEGQNEAIGERSVWEVYVRYVEVYCEAISDLLNGGSSVTLREECSESSPKTSSKSPSRNEFPNPPSQGASFVLMGAKRVKAENAQDLLRLLRQGNKLRHTSSTGANEHSSRSHAIFVLELIEVRHYVGVDGEPTCARSKHLLFRLVDLAGSERVSQSNAEGQQLKEARDINLSLFTLGRVIEALSDASAKRRGGNQGMRPPYRSSTLTKLLRDAFGGNSKTSLIATVVPFHSHRHQTVQTLQYAAKARRVVNRPQVSEVPGALALQQAMEELGALREELARMQRLGTEQSLTASQGSHTRSKDTDALQALEGELREARERLRREQAAAKDYEIEMRQREASYAQRMRESRKEKEELETVYAGRMKAIQTQLQQDHERERQRIEDERREAEQQLTRMTETYRGNQEMLQKSLEDAHRERRQLAERLEKEKLTTAGRLQLMEAQQRLTEEELAVQQGENELLQMDFARKTAAMLEKIEGLEGEVLQRDRMVAEAVEEVEAAAQLREDKLLQRLADLESTEERRAKEYMEYVDRWRERCKTSEKALREAQRQQEEKEGEARGREEALLEKLRKEKEHMIEKSQGWRARLKVREEAWAEEAAALGQQVKELEARLHTSEAIVASTRAANRRLEEASEEEQASWNAQWQREKKRIADEALQREKEWEVQREAGEARLKEAEKALSRVRRRGFTSELEHQMAVALLEKALIVAKERIQFLRLQKIIQDQQWTWLLEKERAKHSPIEAIQHQSVAVMQEEQGAFVQRAKELLDRYASLIDPFTMEDELSPVGLHSTGTKSVPASFHVEDTPPPLAGEALEKQKQEFLVGLVKTLENVKRREAAREALVAQAETKIAGLESHHKAKQAALQHESRVLDDKVRELNQTLLRYQSRNAELEGEVRRLSTAELLLPVILGEATMRQQHSEAEWMARLGLVHAAKNDRNLVASKDSTQQATAEKEWKDRVRQLEYTLQGQQAELRERVLAADAQLQQAREKDRRLKEEMDRGRETDRGLKSELASANKAVQRFRGLCEQLAKKAFTPSLAVGTRRAAPPFTLSSMLDRPKDAPSSYCQLEQVADSLEELHEALAVQHLQELVTTQQTLCREAIEREETTARIGLLRLQPVALQCARQSHEMAAQRRTAAVAQGRLEKERAHVQKLEAALEDAKHQRLLGEERARTARGSIDEIQHALEKEKASLVQKVRSEAQAREREGAKGLERWSQLYAFTHRLLVEREQVGRLGVLAQESRAWERLRWSVSGPRLCTSMAETSLGFLRDQEAAEWRTLMERVSHALKGCTPNIQSSALTRRGEDLMLAASREMAEIMQRKKALAAEKAKQTEIEAALQREVEEKTARLAREKVRSAAIEAASQARLEVIAEELQRTADEQQELETRVKAKEKQLAREREKLARLRKADEDLHSALHDCQQLLEDEFGEKMKTRKTAAYLTEELLTSHEKLQADLKEWKRAFATLRVSGVIVCPQCGWEQPARHEEREQRCRCCELTFFSSSPPPCGIAPLVMPIQPDHTPGKPFRRVLSDTSFGEGGASIPLSSSGCGSHSSSSRVPCSRSRSQPETGSSVSPVEHQEPRTARLVSHARKSNGVREDPESGPFRKEPAKGMMTGDVIPQRPHSAFSSAMKSPAYTQPEPPTGSRRHSSSHQRLNYR